MIEQFYLTQSCDPKRYNHFGTGRNSNEDSTFPKIQN